MTITTTPLVSIVMPVYNAQDYLSSALESIIAQSYENWELIAVDDKSSDTSKTVLHEYVRRDPRIRVLSNAKNLGVGHSFDRGVAVAEGKYIARMDADDISYPKRLEKEVRFLEENPNVVAVGGQVSIINRYGEEIGSKLFPTDAKILYDMLYYSVPIQQSSIMINRPLLPPDFTWSDGWKKAQDLYLYFKLVRYGDLANLEDVVLGYREHPHGISQVSPKDTFVQTKKVRVLAVGRFDYSPSLRARAISTFQQLVVPLIPETLVSRIYKRLRSFIVLELPSEKKIDKEEVDFSKGDAIEKVSSIVKANEK